MIWHENGSLAEKNFNLLSVLLTTGKFEDTENEKSREERIFFFLKMLRYAKWHLWHLRFDFNFIARRRLLTSLYFLIFPGTLTVSIVTCPPL